jgi:hypothetical protein
MNQTYDPGFVTVMNALSGMASYVTDQLWFKVIGAVLVLVVLIFLLCAVFSGKGEKKR